MKLPGNNPRHARLVPPARHLDFVARRAYWNGNLRRMDLERMLGISSDYARRLIVALRTHVALSARGKAYVLDDPETPPAGISGEGFLDDAKAALHEHLSVESVAGVAIPVQADPVAPNGVDTRLLWRLVTAIREQWTLTIEILPLAPDAQATSHAVEPVALLQAAGNWYVHGFDLGRQQWIDFPLPLVLVASRRPEMARHVADDSPELALVTLQLRPHPALNAQQQQLVATLWHMREDKLVLTLSRAQARYFCEQYVADPDIDPDPPWKVLVKN